MSNKINLTWKNAKAYLILAAIIFSIIFSNILGIQHINAQEHTYSNRTRELLANMGIYPYPERKELKTGIFNKKWLQCIPLSPKDINEDFSNLEDLKWLEPIAKNSKVFLLGEYHYYQTIQHLRNRILFALNAFDSYPLIIIERQYSVSGFFDYYIGLADDKEAEDFYQNVIYDLVSYEEGYKLLEHLRRWNRMHPNKRIHLGASDLEHDIAGTLRRVIIPYFQLLDPSFDIDLKTFSRLDLETLLPKLERQLYEAKAKNIIGPYSFLTPEYIECVIENMKSLFLCYRYDFSYYRQQAIVRNLTDPRFFGKYFTAGKVMIHGGSYHLPSHFPYPDGENFYREGSYLSFDFEPTRGKTYSLLIHGMAYQIGSMANADLDTSLHHGRGYRNIIKKFQGAHKQGFVESKNYYLFYAAENDLDKLIFTAAYAYDHRPVLIKNLDWNKLIEKSKNKSNKLYNIARTGKEQYDRYDAHILVFRSPISRVKRKK